MCRLRNIRLYVPWLLYLQNIPRLYIHYAKLGNTTKLPIERIRTAVYTLNERTFIFLHSVVQYIPSVNTVNYQGVESTPTTIITHTFSSLISYFNWNTHMTVFSATVLLANHIKTQLTTLSLSLHGMQIQSHLRTVHICLLLLITFHHHILFHQMSIPYPLNLLSLLLQMFNLYLRLQLRIQTLSLVVKPYTRTLWSYFTYVLSI